MSRRRWLGSVARAAMNFAAVGSSRNFGRSPVKMGTRRGASGSSQSMMRSKNVRSIPRLCRMVWLLSRLLPRLPGRAASVSLNDSMWRRSIAATDVHSGSVAVRCAARWRSASDAAVTVPGRDETAS